MGGKYETRVMDPSAATGKAPAYPYGYVRYRAPNGQYVNHLDHQEQHIFQLMDM
jgi:hypothetical protein